MIDSNQQLLPADHQFSMKIKTIHALFYVSLIPLPEMIKLSKLHANHGICHLLHRLHVMIILIN